MGNEVDIDSLLPEIEAKPELPEPELNTEAPPDKEPRPRDEKTGQFAGEKPKADAAKEPAKPEGKPEVRAEPKTMPLAAYLEDKNKWTQKMEAMERELQALKNPPKPPEQPPEDPKAYADFKVKAALDELAGTKKEVEQVKQAATQSQQQTEQMQFVQQLQTAETLFVRENPDYYEALEHVRNYRRAQLRLLAPEAQPEEIDRYIGQEEMQAAAQLAKARRNPIEVVYSMAKAIGFQSKPAADVVQLPQVPGTKQLPPDQTLGSGAAPAADDNDASQGDPFTEAFSEMFGKRKAS